jgi:hypothetical protein
VVIAEAVDVDLLQFGNPALPGLLVGRNIGVGRLGRR